MQDGKSLLPQKNDRSVNRAVCQGREEEHDRELLPFN